MRKLLACLCAAVLLVCLPLSGLAAGSYYGTVVCDSSVTVRAPFGGTLADISVRPGSRVLESTGICTIETTAVYAPADGTVSAVFIRPGDSVESIKTLYTNLVYIIPKEKYSVSASLQNAAKRDENCYVSVGQTVYLESGAGELLKTGTGFVTSVTAANPETETSLSYTVQISEGDFFLDEKVYIFWAESRDRKSGLGSGTIGESEAVTVSGEGGSVLRVHVKPGDTVKRGDLLYETVTGDLAGLKGRSNRIPAGVTGIVSASEMTDGATVEKGASLITVYPQDCLQVCLAVSEPDLKSFPVGTALDLFFSGKTESVPGTVSSISYLAETTESGSRSSAYANYKVYIDFEADDSVRLGMLVSVEIP